MSGGGRIAEIARARATARMALASFEDVFRAAVGRERRFSDKY